MARTREAAPAGDEDTGYSEEDDGLGAEEEKVFRISGVTYLQIPALDAHDAGVFYHEVFDWNLSGDPEYPSFDDGTGHVLGTWVIYRQPAPADAGVLVYVFVESLEETLDKVAAHGGAIKTVPFQDGDLWIATFTDPTGNAIGLWSRRGR